MKKQLFTFFTVLSLILSLGTQSFASPSKGHKTPKTEKQSGEKPKKEKSEEKKEKEFNERSNSVHNPDRKKGLDRAAHVHELKKQDVKIKDQEPAEKD